MVNFSEFRDRLAADSLRRAVRRDQLRVFRFEFLQTLQQPVEFPIADFRRCLNVILAAVKFDLRSQLLDLLMSRTAHSGLRSTATPVPSSTGRWQGERWLITSCCVYQPVELGTAPLESVDLWLKSQLLERDSPLFQRAAMHEPLACELLCAPPETCPHVPSCEPPFSRLPNDRPPSGVAPRLWFAATGRR